MFKEHLRLRTKRQSLEREMLRERKKKSGTIVDSFGRNLIER